MRLSPALLASLLVLAPLAAQELPRPLEFYQRTAAEKFGSQLTAPAFESTAEAIEKTAADTLAEADAGLAKIGRQTGGEAAFATTIGALDDVLYAVNTVASRLALIKETSQDAALRAAAQNALQRIQQWSVGAEYREDVYAAVQTYAKTQPRLAGEEAKLFTETLRDFKRAGLGLPPSERKEIERERKELAVRMTQFGANQSNAKASVVFTRAELEGVPESYLNNPQIKTGGDQFTVGANQTYQYTLVMDHAKREETRRRLYVAHDNLAREKNEPLLNSILALRASIARRLGYASWADYQIEPKMAKNAATASRFIDELIAGTQPKFDAEIAAMQRLKAADTGDPAARIATWDWHYYQNEIKRTRFAVDTESLRVFFPYQRVLEGMFSVYERNFGLKFYPVEPPFRWVEDLRCFVTTDARTGEPLGLFYLDMFPREGKFNHFAQFSIIDGKALPEGRYQRPTCALLCNFPPPAGGNPALLRHDDVVTLFHEFGHALHTMLTRARFGRFAGTNVPRDFVETPSKMLENWAWDKAVLDEFAADYRDTAKKIPAETIEKMRGAKLATAAVLYRRQCALATLDLALHGPHPVGAKPFDAVAFSNRILERVFLPVDPNTAFVAGFGHLMGYDAGYYGYLWADSLAADMATLFRRSKGGFLDRDVGRRLRTEIYEPGDSRDVNESLGKFLGRQPSVEPFLENTLGLKKRAGAS